MSPRERDTVIAALRLWQKTNRDPYFYDSLLDGLQDIATDGGTHDALDANEIDILIEDKINGAKDETAKTVDIIVEVEGGIVENVNNIPAGCRVVVRDADTDGGSFDYIVKIDGEDYYQSIFKPDGTMTPGDGTDGPNLYPQIDG